ncbi:MAG: hypothetical protein L0H25_07600 [Micrococcales bacterium]|nr:hypothetical protein [Micrococcales bacterium]
MLIYDIDGNEKVHCFLAKSAQVMVAKFEPKESYRQAAIDMEWKRYAEWPTFSVAGRMNGTDWARIVKAMNAGGPGASS